MPTMLAAGYGHLDIVTYLIKSGADLNYRGSHGWTALHLAIRYGYMEIARFLISSGAKEDIAGNDSVSPNKAAQQTRC